jgi:hypothetical protein
MSDGRLGLVLLGLVLQMWSLESLRRIIQPKITGRELKRVKWTFPDANVKTGAGTTGLLAGAALWVPAVTQAVRVGQVNFDAFCWLVFGIALLLSGAWTTFQRYEKRMA